MPKESNEYFSEEMVRDINKLLKLYRERLPSNFAAVCDILRALNLYINGGYYSDVDDIPTSFLKEKFEEYLRKNPDKNFISCDCNNSQLYAKTNHLPELKSILENMIKNEREISISEIKSVLRGKVTD